MGFLRASAIYAAANVASAAVPFMLLPMLTRLFSPAEYGQVVSFALWVALCTPLAGLSMHGAVGVAWFSRKGADMQAFTGTAASIALACTATLATTVALLMSPAPALGLGLTPAWAAVAAITAGAGILFQCRLVLWQSQQRPAANAVFQIGASLLNIVLSLAAVLLLGWGGEGRNAGIAIAATAMALTAVVSLRRRGELRWAPRSDHARALLAFGLPLVPHALAGVLLGTADRWFVSLYLGAQSLGVYGAGAQLGMVMSVVADAVVKAYSPWLYSMLKSGKRGDRLCVVGAIYASVPAFALIAAIVGIGLLLVSDMLLGPQYRAASDVLPWFVFGGACSGIYYCISGLYFFKGRTGLLAVATVTAALLATPLTWLFVATLGTLGAAIGFACTQVLLTVCVGVVASRSFDLPWCEPRVSLSIWFRRALARPGARIA